MSVDLFHYQNEVRSPTMFIEATKRDAKRAAKKAGWKLLPSNRCLCPLHARTPERADG